MPEASLSSSLLQRVVIEHVSPTVDCGAFPIKRCIGERVSVMANIHLDGTDHIAAILNSRLLSHPHWDKTFFTIIDPGKDLWQATLNLESIGTYEFFIEAWVDAFSTWRYKLGRKSNAGQDVEQDLKEGALLLHSAFVHSQGHDLEILQHHHHVITTSNSMTQRLAAANDPDVASIMKRSGNNGFSTKTQMFLISVERKRASIGAWYEFFPRSSGTGTLHSATFQEAEQRLEGIAQMGFDVVYLPPIHPIGRTFRKGSNNNPVAGPGDSGSPWAIGALEGGHTAVHPELGTLSDFHHFVEKAKSLNLEIALDLAYQCAPDHPYVKDHPEWFHHRPDGTIQCAENPPKLYEDIYPINFECEQWEALWNELKQVVLFWIHQDVRIFRVDNPHTKPYRFWEWLIREIRKESPDVIFLAEAFTRPAVMQYLGKIGFSQSYTYFTWRTTQKELTEYVTELTQTVVRDFMRPNFFVNTPDILHEFLQTGGCPAFQLRFILAATLSSNYGIYGPPFELCENQAFPGTEDYVDSEKYQIRQWEWDRPGNIKSLIGDVNRARRENPSLLVNETIRFYSVDNPQLLCYGKTLPDGSNPMLIVVNLDPKNVQSGWIQVPYQEWHLPEQYFVFDLLSNQSYAWKGASNFIKLDPQERVAHLFKVTS